jgi:hypothetical protein
MMNRNGANAGVWINSGVAIGVSVGVALGYIIPGLLIGAMWGWMLFSLKNPPC